MPSMCKNLHGPSITSLLLYHHHHHHHLRQNCSSTSCSQIARHKYDHDPSTTRPLQAHLFTCDVSPCPLSVGKSIIPPRLPVQHTALRELRRVGVQTARSRSVTVAWALRHQFRLWAWKVDLRNCFDLTPSSMFSECLKDRIQGLAEIWLRLSVRRWTELPLSLRLYAAENSSVVHLHKLDNEISNWYSLCYDVIGLNELT